MSIYPEIITKKLPAPAKFDWVEVVEDCVVNDPVKTLIIPKGYVSNGASVPRLFWWLIPPHGRSFSPAILHDCRYENSLFMQELGRAVARHYNDLRFRQDLLEAGVPRWQANIMYYYVRLLGWRNWQRFIKINHSSTPNSPIGG